MRSFVFQVFKHMCVCCCDLSSRGLFSSYVFRDPLSAGQHLKAPYETMPHACHMMRMDTLHAAKGQCREVAVAQCGLRPGWVGLRFLEQEVGVLTGRGGPAAAVGGSATIRVLVRVSPGPLGFAGTRQGY